MSEEQEDAVVGRMVKEYATLRKRLTTLRAEADRIGETLETLGRNLKRGDIDSVKVEPGIITDSVVELILEYQEKDRKRRTLRAQLSELGMDEEYPDVI